MSLDESLYDWENAGRLKNDSKTAVSENNCPFCGGELTGIVMAKTFLERMVKLSNYIWVVEMWNTEKKRWETTIGVRLTKSDILEERREWNDKNPNDTFRIRKYVSI